MNARWTNRLMAALAVLVPFCVYVKTFARQVPFWDAGEFIAVSKILGIPHPPGTPLFVLTGHVFGLILPWWNYAARINFVSVITGMITILFTYLLVQKVVMHLPLVELEDDRTRRWMSYIAGMVAAWYTAFSHSFWNTSTEIAHVHVGASAVMFFSLWTAMNWWDRHGEDQNERRLLAIWYFMCVGIGWHLGGFLVLPAVVLFALVVDWRRSWWMALGVFIFMAWMSWTTYLEDTVHIQPDIKGAVFSFLGLLAICVVLHFILSKSLRPFLWLTVGAFLVGLSVHVYLVVRATQNPMINEAAPSTWSALWDEFTRKQYAPPSPLQRSGTWTYQLDYMFFRYFRDEFTLGPPMNSYPGVRPWTGFLGMLAMGIPLVVGEFGRLFQLLKGRLRAEWWVTIHAGVWVAAALLYGPLNAHALAIFLVFLMMILDLLLAIGWKNEPFVLLQSCFLVGSLGLILYLNFKDPQVRERDYFFLWGYECFALWIGIGVIGIIHEALRWAKAQTSAKRLLVPALGMLGLAMPVAACAHFFFEQDHTGNYVAHDYAYNMLEPLAKDAIIFTNGDNDTFPLWYLQEVEHVRNDVRLINLSLLNTNWYIKQLRDLEPKVPIRLSDAEVDAMEPYRAEDGTIVLVKDLMVKHIVQENQFRKPLYIAVTVPEDMGLERHFSLEGLSFRVLPDTLHSLVNLDVTKRLVYHEFLYRGLLDKDGNFTSVPYKDENQTRLAGNYSAAHVRLAFAYHEKGDMPNAFQELDRAERISSDFPGVALARGVFYEEINDTLHAMNAFEDGLKRYPSNSELNYRLGILYALHGRLRDGYQRLETARQLDPDNSTVVLSTFTILAELREPDKADEMMRNYLDRHPEDTRAQQAYRSVMRSFGRQPAEFGPQPRGGGTPGGGGFAPPIVPQGAP